MAVGILLVISVNSNPAVHAQIKFVSPLGGTAFQDWVIGGYNDVDRRPGIFSDYRGGTYGYDGHDALDIGLAHFRKMDEGVDVLAAAAGTVVTALDGAYDRWTGSNPAPSGEVGNLVTIDHGGGLRTTYAHLKRDSVAVTVGQSVVAGELLGEVGSSGQSSGPHLHFAVYKNGRPIETYFNPELWWYEPLPYTGDRPGVLDAGISDHWPGPTEIESGVQDHRVYSTADGAGQLAVMWVYFYGMPAGADISFLYRRPNGSVHANYQWALEDGAGAGFWNTGIEIPTTRSLGTWEVEFHVNGDRLLSRTFQVVASVPEPTGVCIVALLMVLGLNLRIRRLPQ